MCTAKLIIFQPTFSIRKVVCQKTFSTISQIRFQSFLVLIELLAEWLRDRSLFFLRLECELRVVDNDFNNMVKVSVFFTAIPVILIWKKFILVCFSGPLFPYMTVWPCVKSFSFTSQKFYVWSLESWRKNVCFACLSVYTCYVLRPGWPRGTVRCIKANIVLDWARAYLHRQVFLLR